MKFYGPFTATIGLVEFEQPSVKNVHKTTLFFISFLKETSFHFKNEAGRRC